MTSETDLQDLPPSLAHFCLKIERFLTQELQIDLNQKTLLLAVSAGVDSTALVLFCQVMNKRWRSHLIAAHLDHNLRPISGQEAKEVKSLCARLDIPFYLGNSKVKTYASRKNIGLEEAGRTIRYSFLLGLMRKTGADYLLTAHHLNDLAEDFLLRQIRGTAWPAMAGMPAFEPNYRLLRPFLLCPKKSLIELVQSQNLSWQEDESNQDLSFQRNRIRHNILPLLLKENPNFLQTVKQFWRQAQLDKNHWERELAKLRQKEDHSSDSIFISRKDLLKQSKALRLRWYRDILLRIGPGQVLASNLFQLDESWENNRINKAFQFPRNKQVRLVKEGLRFERKDNQNN